MLGTLLGGVAASAMLPAAGQEQAAVTDAPTGDTITAEVCVIGGGSGGFGAALAAARQGANVVLIEKNQMLGGTSTVAWVHTWEPSRGGGGIPQDLWRVMKEDPLASPQDDYRAGEPRQGGSWLTWEPRTFQWAAARLLEETGRCRVFYNAFFTGAEMDGGTMKAARCMFGGMPFRVEAPVFIDCTADANVCVAAGCETRLGEDPKSLFNEPNAPNQPTDSLNGMTLMYRITDTGEKQPTFLPPNVEKGACGKPAALRTCANGDVLVNAVNMVPGNCVLREDMASVMRRAAGLVFEHFYWMQTEREYATWTIAGMAPEVGVRETRRAVCDYTLTEHDCQQGVAQQPHEDIVAITDHAVDIHGPKSKLYEVPNGAYGVPFRCLLPQHTTNLLVACRGAGFTHIAASSCRLSRVMMTLGQAAGNAAAMAVAEKSPLRTVDVRALRDALTAQGVELS